MNPKEKAEELIAKFRIYATSRGEDDGYCESTRAKACKQCALLCVDELIKNATWEDYSYYKEVKQELEKL
jgi:hypothetical protein